MFPPMRAISVVTSAIPRHQRGGGDGGRAQPPRRQDRPRVQRRHVRDLDFADGVWDCDTPNERTARRLRSKLASLERDLYKTTALLALCEEEDEGTCESTYD